MSQVGSGFGVGEMLITVCALTTLLTISVPFAPGVRQSHQSRAASHEINAELQTARLSVVTANPRDEFAAIDPHHKSQPGSNNIGIENSGAVANSLDPRLGSPSIAIAAAPPIVPAQHSRARPAEAVTVTSPSGRADAPAVKAGGQAFVP